jgi:hypothetical protein
MLSWNDFDQLSRHHCGLCHALRRDYHFMAGMLAGMEGRFLVLLIDAQTQKPAYQNMKRCPANAGLRRLKMTDYSNATRFAAAVSVYLFEQKLIDDVIDENSVRAKFIGKLLRKFFKNARQVLSETAFPLEVLTLLYDRQQCLEQLKTNADLEIVTEPFGRAMAILLAHTAELAGALRNRRILGEIGYGLGRSITLIDACQDFVRDQDRNHYNAIQNAFGNGRSCHELTCEQFDRLENYLLYNLKSIRSKVERLSLNRHRRIIQNVLMLGLYDEAAKALNKLSTVASSPYDFAFSGHECAVCGLHVKSPFCPFCGTNRMFGPFQTLPPAHQ